MKTMMKIMIGVTISVLMVLGAQAQPKSDLPDDNKTKMNWAGADTLYTFEFDAASNSWIYFQREIRRFNAKSDPLENFVQVYDRQTTKWDNYLKVNYSYNEKGYETEEITQTWDKNFNNWVNAKLRTTSYKGNQKDEILFQEWKRPTNEWFNVMKYLLKYNSNGEQNIVTINLYNGISKNWDNHKRFTMDYEYPFNPPTTVVSESFLNGEWKTDGQYIMAYNMRGNKISETRYTWNQSKRSWLEGIQLDMMYDKKGNQTEFVEKKYDIQSKDWTNFSRFIATYNESNYMIEKIEYTFDRKANQWVESGKFKFTTDKKI